MFDAIFRFFFNLSPVVFSQGEYRFAPTTGSYVAVVLVGAAAALTIIAYRSGRGRRATARRSPASGSRSSPSS